MKTWVVLQWAVFAIASGFAANAVLCGKESRFLRALAVILLSGFLWAFGRHMNSTLYVFFPNEQLFHVGMNIAYLGMSALGPACMYMAWCYSGRYRFYGNKGLVAGIYGLSAVFFLLFATNGIHHLYYTGSFVDIRYGPLEVAISVWSYLCFLYTWLLIARTRWDALGRPSWLYLLCFLPPVVADAVGTFGGNHLFGFAPLAYSLLVAGVYLHAYLYHAFNLSPIAAKKVFDGLADPVMILGSRQDILYQNSSAARLGIAPPLESWQPDLVRDVRVYRPHTAHTKTGDAVVVFNDITDQINALYALNRQNRALAEMHRTLDRQTEALRQSALAAKDAAAEKQRMDIMQEISDEVEALLPELKAIIERNRNEFSAADVEEGIRLSSRAMAAARRVINEFRERHSDGL